MESDLTVSSQGQIVIPAKIRKVLGIKPGQKINLKVVKKGIFPKAVISPQPKSWVKQVRGLGKGIWGKGEVFIEKSRSEWDRNET